jgi:hypothetical protein
MLYDSQTNAKNSKEARQINSKVKLTQGYANISSISSKREHIFLPNFLLNLLKNS